MTNRNFRETLKLAQKLEISTIDLNIADECDCRFDFDYSDEQFEKLCYLVKEAYLRSDYIAVVDIVGALCDIIADEGLEKTLEEISPLQLLDKASYYC